MARQNPANTDSSPEMERDDWAVDEEVNASETDSTIYKKDSINPAKRRRLEAMREERELMNDIRDVFDDYDD